MIRLKHMAILALTLTFWPSFAPAEESVPVLVRIEIAFDEAKEWWKAEGVEKVRKELTSSVVRHLNDTQKLSHWKFTDKSERSRYKVVLSLDNFQSESIDFIMEPSPAEGDFEDPWYVPWKKPADIAQQGKPKNVDKAIEDLSIRFKKKFLRKHRDRIRKWLDQMVPLATTAEWDRAAADTTFMPIVLPLPGEKYEILNHSWFKVRAASDGGTEVVLTAVAVGEATDYPPPPAESLFKGLVIVPRARQVRGDSACIEELSRTNLSELHQLKLREVYLQRFVPRNAADSDDCFGGGL